jgi:hypothetical protein
MVGEARALSLGPFDQRRARPSPSPTRDVPLPMGWSSWSASTSECRRRWKVLQSLALKGRRFKTWEHVCQAIFVRPLPLFLPLRILQLPCQP